MPEYNPPRRLASYVFTIGLPSQANPKVFQTNPTLATGDVKVSKDGGSLANIATLPTVSPAGGKIVQVTLNASEMNADTVTVVFSDAAGDEWCDVLVTIHTTSLIYQGEVDDSEGGGTTEFDTTLTGFELNTFEDSWLIFVTGVNRGQCQRIASYDGSAGTFTFDGGFAMSPANGDEFMILGKVA